MVFKHEQEFLIFQQKMDNLDKFLFPQTIHNQKQAHHAKRFLKTFLRKSLQSVTITF